jgi:hypothetical protein
MKTTKTIILRGVLFLKKINYNKYPTSTTNTVFSILAAIFLLISCSNSSFLIEKKKEIERMSDSELLSYYHLINNRLDDIDRDTEQKKVVNNHNYDPNRDRIPHLHIGDSWGHLKQERKLVLNEMYKRNITP